MNPNILSSMLQRIRVPLRPREPQVTLGLFGKLSRDPDYQRHWPRPTAGIAEAFDELSFGLRARAAEGTLESCTFAELPFGEVGLAIGAEEVVLVRLEPMPAAGFPLLLAASVPPSRLDGVGAWTLLDGLERLAFAVRQADESGRGPEVPRIVDREERLVRQAMAETDRAPADEQRLADEAAVVAGLLRASAPGDTEVAARSRTPLTQLLIVHQALGRLVTRPAGARILVARGGRTRFALCGGFEAVLDLVLPEPEPEPEPGVVFDATSTQDHRPAAGTGLDRIRRERPDRQGARAMSDRQNIETGRVVIKLKEPGGEVRDVPPIDGILVASHVGDGGPDEPVFERTPVRLDRDGLGRFMADCNIALDVDVPDRLGDDPESRIATRLRFEDVDDFDPDAFLRQVPSAARLLELRAALDDFRRRRVGNPAVRRELEAIVNDGVRRRALAAADGTSASASTPSTPTPDGVDR